MPFLNEHSARVKNPDIFEPDSFRRKNIAPGVDIIIGKEKGSDNMSTQTYRFDASKFTPSEAHQWLKDNNVDFISFEKSVNNAMYLLPIIGVIGEDFRVTDALMHINNAKDFPAIKLMINSPGGDVDEADKIANVIIKSGKEIYSHNTGDVASAASRIFCVAPKDNRTFDNTKGIFLIHNPWATIEGDASVMEMAAKELKKTEKKYCEYYAERTGTSIEVIEGFMAENIPLTAEQVESLGFAKVTTTVIKALAFINLTQNKKMDKNLSTIETMLNRISAWLKIKALIVTDVNGNELDFPEAKSPEELTVGQTVMVAGTPAAGEFVMPTGEVYKCEGGKLMEIVMPEPSEVEMLKEKISTLEAEKEAAVAAQVKVSNELNEMKAKAEAEFSALSQELAKIKAQFNPAKPMQNAPSASNQGANRKLLNLK